MAKYETKFKHEVVQRYLSDGGSAKGVGKEYRLDQSTVRRWVQSYRHHGLNGLNKKFEHYSAEFKLSVLKRMKKERMSYREVEAVFNLRGCGTVSRWERLYHEQGLDGLKPKPKVRPTMMKPKLPVPAPQKKADETRSRKDLEDEVEYLRAEVAYLKKLGALMQAKEKAALKKRG